MIRQIEIKIKMDNNNKNKSLYIIILIINKKLKFYINTSQEIEEIMPLKSFFVSFQYLD